MANEVQKPDGGSHPVSLSPEYVAKLLAGVENSVASTPLMGGKPLLRMLKTGQWVFGQTDEPVQQGSSWAINPMSLKHGWICWSNYPGNQKNELLGEIVVPVYEAKPAEPPPIGEFPWKEQRVFELKCLDGEDEGTEVLYKGASYGAIQSVVGLFQSFAEQLKRDPSHPVPVVMLDSDSYDHPKYGQTFKPILEIVGWLNMAGKFDSTAVAQQQPQQPVPPPPEPSQPPSSQPDHPTPSQPSPPDKPVTATVTKLVKPPLDKPPLTGERPGAAPRRQRPVGRT